TLKRTLRKKESIIIIPLVGALEYDLEGDEPQAIIPGEAWILPSADSSVCVRNPYDDELINFLYLAFSAPLSATIPVVEIKLEEGNVLHPFAGNFGGVFCYMGIYDCRKEDIYKVRRPGHGIFVFVINGAFEVSGRLLEERDGLAMWNVEETDFESLSNNAILLVIEVPL
ncbi:pirin family protein, partial [Flavobacterium sp.]